MYLTRLIINKSRLALTWVANPYRVHQRLCMACEGDARLLFRIEASQQPVRILVQTHQMPDWSVAFNEFQVLAKRPEWKQFDPILKSGSLYRFRLLANPIVKRQAHRFGLFQPEEQRIWLERKLVAGGAKIVNVTCLPHGLQRSSKNPTKDASIQSHFSVLFEGELFVTEPDKLFLALQHGIGPAKAYGFGLLSLARVHTSNKEERN